jgi:PAS domain S-box-containing protein
MLSTAELSRRPTRPPDLKAENRALIALARELAASPERILQKLADTALELCRAHSAGLSILEDGDQRQNFHWRAIAGRWAPHVNGGTPRNFGPCGTVLDRNMPLICSHPERDFPYWADVQPVLDEGLLIPIYIKGEAVGTIWIVTHDASRRFDAEDLRVMTNLGAFAAAAYQTSLLFNSVQRIAAIVDSSDDAIVSETIDGVITSWNAGAERLFGYAAKEIIGKPIMILIPPDRLEEETETIERIRLGEHIEHYETVRRHKHGSFIEISLTVSPIKNSEGKVIGASKIARGIAERKRQEAHMTVLAREADHRAKNVLATVQATVNLSQSETPEGLKRAITGRLRALANVHKIFVESRRIGAELRSLVAAELAPYCPAGDTQARIEGPSVLLEPMTAQAIAVGIHELATNAAKYGALSLPAGKIHVDWSRTANGRVILHWTETGGPLVEPPTRRGFGMQVLETMICKQLGGEARFDWHSEGMACTIILPPRVPSALAAPVNFPIALLPHSMVLQTEENLPQHVEAARMARTTTAAAMGIGLAHQLSQPLSALTTYIHAGRRLLKVQPVDHEILAETMEKAEIELKRARDVLERLRDFVSGEKVERVPVNLLEITRTVVDLVRHSAEARAVRINIESGPLPMLLADAVQIKQVLLNLINNAIDAAAETSNGVVDVRCCHGGATIEIEVIDNGNGIASDLAEHLFEPFQTNKPHGMGLGLPLSRQIIEAHGGRIWWEGAVPQGTRFHLQLPVNKSGRCEA